MSKILIVLLHNLLLWLVKADADSLEEKVNLILLILKHAHIEQNTLILKHKDAVLHTWRNYAQEFFHFVLGLQRRRILHNLMAHLLLQIKLQLQINHCCVHFGEFALKGSILLIQR